MAKEKEKPQETVEIEQSESFGPINERIALIDKVYKKNEKEVSDPGEEQKPEEEGLLDQEPEESEITEEAEEEKPDFEPAQEKEADFKRLKSDYENLKGQNTEEREKRKVASSERDQLKAQLNEVLQDFKRLKEENEALKDGEYSQFESEEGGQNAVMTELRQLRDEIKSLKGERAKEKAESSEKRHQRLLSETDKELTAEGYPGFRIARAEVTDELVKLVREDPDNQYLDGPEGWKKIYKEKIWPNLEQHFAEVYKKKSTDSKIESKKKANVVMVPGKSPVKKSKSDEEWSYEDYMKLRRANQLS